MQVLGLGAVQKQRLVARHVQRLIALERRRAHQLARRLGELAAQRHGRVVRDDAAPAAELGVATVPLLVLDPPRVDDLQVV